MKIRNLLVMFAVAMMLFPMFTGKIRISGKPQTATSTIKVGSNAWGPTRADTVAISDRASMEVASQCYDNLIVADGEHPNKFKPGLAKMAICVIVQVVYKNLTNNVDFGHPKNSLWWDESGMQPEAYVLKGWDRDTERKNGKFAEPEPASPPPHNPNNDPPPHIVEGDNLIFANSTTTLQWSVWKIWNLTTYFGEFRVLLTLGREEWVLPMWATPTKSFYDGSGTSVAHLHPRDVKYTFQRGLVQDQPGSPMWMLYEAFFGTMDNRVWNENGTANGGSVMDLAHLIDDAIAVDEENNTVTFRLGSMIPETTFMEILTSTCTAINSMDYSISIGCWDGDLFNTSKHGGPAPDWWTDWAGIDRSPYDERQPDGHGGYVYNYKYCGTGPYHVSTFDPAGSKVVLQSNPGYWGGWPAPGCNSSLDMIEIDYIADWETRKAKFLEGEIDTCEVPTMHMFDLLDQQTMEPVNPQVKTIRNIAPTLCLDANFFTFTVDPLSSYVYSGSFPDGIPLDFFNNTHVRRAFAYSFNVTQYTQQVLYGEADYRKNWLVYGLYPDYYNASIPGYDINYAAAEAELRAAVVDGQNVWDSGFTLGMAYDTGNDQQKKVCEMTRDFFNGLSTYDGRTGSPFTINIVEVDWLTYLELFEKQQLPIFNMGFHADFADANSFARAYMCSEGCFASIQNYTADNGWGGNDYPIRQALFTEDESMRIENYSVLQLVYSDNCPSYPLPTARGRMWCQYWVKGWYFNPLYPSPYYYTMWKQDSPWYDISGTTPGQSDGKVDMKDIAWLIFHFNAKAPLLSGTIDPKWVGVYGSDGCVDPLGDRICNMKDIAGAILHYNKKAPGNP